MCLRDLSQVMPRSWPAPGLNEVMVDHLCERDWEMRRKGENVTSGFSSATHRKSIGQQVPPIGRNGRGHEGLFGLIRLYPQGPRCKTKRTSNLNGNTHMHICYAFRWENTFNLHGTEWVVFCPTVQPFNQVKYTPASMSLFRASQSDFQKV